MNDFNDLKIIKRKLADEEKIEDLLSAIGCEYIKPEQRGGLITAQLPERFYSDNKRSVQVRVGENLTCYIRSRATGFQGDIFNLVSFLHFDIEISKLQEDLPNAKHFVCELFGWSEFLKGRKGILVKKKDYTACLKALLGDRKKKIEIKNNPIYSEDIMDEFYYRGNPICHQGWIDEGISTTTQKIYGVGFDLESKRVAFPLRNRFGQIVGVKGRIMKDEDDPERKYLYLYRCNNRYEWFNWYIAHTHIIQHKRVYIFESEKSSMKAFEYGIYNALSIGASDITPEQALMVKQLGIDVEIVLCYDKGITIDNIKRQAELFEGRKVKAIYDTDDLLQDKNSPIDEGYEKFKLLEDEYAFEINIKDKIA